MTPAMWLQGFLAVVGLLGALIGWFAIRTLQTVDKNQSDIAAGLKEAFGRIHDIEKEFWRLLGEHDKNHV